MELIVNFPEARVRSSNNQDFQYMLNSALQDILTAEPDSPPPQARGPQVSFSAQSEIKFVKNLEYESESALWFTEPEMKSFRRNAQMQVRAIKSRLKSPSDFAKIGIDNTEIFMGLEKYLDDARPQKIRQERKEICDEVFQEQVRQQDEGIFDPDAMANVSEAVSGSSRRRARVIGMIHANASR